MIKRFIRHVRVWWSLLGDPRTPALSKVLPFAAVLYLLVPIDIIPDLLPIVGQVDDVGMLLFLFSIAIRMIPRETWTEQEKKLDQKVIDV